MFSNIYNFKKFSDTLYTAGMPTAEQLKDAVNYGVKTVINLAPHTVSDALPDEEKIVKTSGMEYINIPVVWDVPTEENLIKFMNIMDSLTNKTVFVHCQANFRASSFVTMYRVLRKGWKSNEALDAMHEVWNDADFPIWKEFIEEILEKENLK